MADMMTFPDTVEEFMEEYKLVDTEQVYTNGTELVPIFRMKQWFEHEKAQLFSEDTTKDAISRQAAIDIERNATADTNPSHFEAHQKFTQFMDDAEVSSFGRWQWANGFNTALTAVRIDLKKLPTAQPEPQWIPVSERLPEDGTWNIFTDGRGISVERYKADAIDHFFPNGRWFQLEDATAWMPLPEAYKPNKIKENEQ